MNFSEVLKALNQASAFELHRKQAVILDSDDGRRWLIPYVAINLDGADVQIREQPRQGLGRNEILASWTAISSNVAAGSSASMTRL